MLRLLTLLLLPLTASAGTFDEPNHVDLPDADGRFEADPIVNGELENKWPSVVAIGAANFSACTGSLITPKIILTAGHCGADLPVELVVGFGQAIFGPSVNDADERIGFVDFALHPDYVPLGTSGMSQTLPEFDLALLELDTESTVEPIWIRTDRLKKGEAVGEEVFSVGFGITSSAGQGSGTKRSATLIVDDLDEMFVLSDVSTNPDGANICSGDSGGPQFYQDPETGEWEQWAVHSWGDQNCLFNSGSTRTDIGIDFILDFVEKVHGTTDQCVIRDRYDDGVCDLGCAQTDPDCVVQSDEAALEAIGKGCSTTGSAAGFAWLLLLPLLGRRRR